MMRDDIVDLGVNGSAFLDRDADRLPGAQTLELGVALAKLLRDRSLATNGDGQHDRGGTEDEEQRLPAPRNRPHSERHSPRWRAADTAKAGEDHRLVGASRRQPSEQDPEILFVTVSSHDDLGRSAGIGCVRVEHAVHTAMLLRLKRFIRFR